jgi:hypothetical protein
MMKKGPGQTSKMDRIAMEMERKNSMETGMALERGCVIASPEA